MPAVDCWILWMIYEPLDVDNDNNSEDDSRTPVNSDPGRPDLSLASSMYMIGHF